MDSRDTDRLLEQGLSGDPPAQGFRTGALEASATAFRRARRVRAWWRPALLAAAAVLIATVSFLLGRCSVGTPALPPAPLQVVAGAAEVVTVPDELVEWLQAARFFRQLGMEDRVALAYERASQLVPYEAAGVSRTAGGTFVARVEPDRHDQGFDPDSTRSLSETGVRPPYGQTPSVERVRTIIAQSFGG